MTARLTVSRTATRTRALSYGFLGLCRPEEFERRRQVGEEPTMLGHQLGDPVASAIAATGDRQLAELAFRHLLRLPAV
ncbi:MAG TPA: hypothetical protein VM282_11110 [Acidimicrobiales bacterium]|nr:hypothetical protein [Acidimicrobiales bacterium]